MKRLKRVILFADADEFDRLTSDLPDRERRATACVTVHLRKHHSRERKFLVEFVRRADCILASHGVGHEQDFLGIQQPLQRPHFVHELVVDMETARGVHDQNIGSGVDGFTSRLFGEALDCCCVRFSDFAFVQISFNRLRYNFELLTCSGPIDVNRNQQRSMPAVLQPTGQLARSCGLAGPLKASHKHDRRRL